MENLDHRAKIEIPEKQYMNTVTESKPNISIIINVTVNSPIKEKKTLRSQGKKSTACFMQGTYLKVKGIRKLKIKRKSKQIQIKKTEVPILLQEYFKTMCQIRQSITHLHIKCYLNKFDDKIEL